MVEEQENNLEEIRKLYPQLGSDEQLRLAQARLRNYVRVMPPGSTSVSGESKGRKPPAS